MFDRVYSTITSKADYRILTAIPVIFAVLCLIFFLIHGVSYGLEFQGGSWSEITTNRTFSQQELSQISATLVSAGMEDVQVYVSKGLGTSDNTLVIITKTLVNEGKINEILSPYLGDLRSNDLVVAKASGNPPADFKDKMLSRFVSVDVQVNGSLIQVNALELNPEEVKSAIEYYLGEKVDLTVSKKNLNVRSVGPTLGKTFREQGIKAIFLSFILMGIVVFLAFKEVIPSLAVIQAAVNDVFIALGCMSFFNIPFDSASLGALLMLIGYSVDTDILQTSRVLKQKGREVNESVDGAIKTGLMMTATTTSVMVVTIIVTTFFIPIPTLRTISIVLVFGLIGDLFTTWLTNAGLLKWFVERKKKRVVAR